MKNTITHKTTSNFLTRLMLRSNPRPAVNVQYIRPLNKAGVQLTIWPMIAQGYKKICGAIVIFAFVALLALRKVTLHNHAQRNIKNMIS